MRKLYFLLILAAFVTACQSGDKKAEQTAKEKISPEALNKIISDSTKFTKLEWLDSTHIKLEAVKEGKIVEVSFRFKNIGSKPLVITNVTASCGCTTPDKPEAPIAPGEESVIKAKFDSKGRVGLAEKTIHVSANTDPSTEHTLSFSVNVEKL